LIQHVLDLGGTHRAPKNLHFMKPLSCSFQGPVLVVLSLLASGDLVAQTGPPLTIQRSGSNQIQITWSTGTNLNVLQELSALGSTNVWREVSDAPSILGTHFQVRRAATNVATFYRLASHGALGVSTPADPASVAPPLALNQFNPFGASTAFLYTGSNAMQIGVAPGTIQDVQAAVLRGTVRKRDNTPLPGVRVALLNHPEFGYTYTKTNGMFDLAVNASLYTVDFQAIGYLPVQRQTQVTGQNYSTLLDVVMMQVDAAGTVVALGSNAPPQMHRAMAPACQPARRTSRRWASRAMSCRSWRRFIRRASPCGACRSRISRAGISTMAWRRSPPADRGSMAT
jgi:hypothetical protein